MGALRILPPPKTQPADLSGQPSPGCPAAESMLLAAIGKLPLDKRQEFDEHLQRCSTCAAMRTDLIEEVAAWGNRFMLKGHLIWLCDTEWLKPFKKYLFPDAAQGHPMTRIIDRRFTLIQMAKSVRKQRGSTAECGVLYGVGSAMICKALEGAYTEGEHHLGFDSFQGLSEPSAVDINEYSWQRKGSLSVPSTVASHLLSEFGFCRLVKGWVPDCLGVAADFRFRLVHLDMDLYQPTLDALAFFYPRMVPGGVLVLDDYGHMTCLGVRKAVGEFFADKPETVIETVDGVGFAFKSHADAGLAAA